jgi:Ni,Fe-hydrogenase I cytochrome b subunit
VRLYFINDENFKVSDSQIINATTSPVNLGYSSEDPISKSMAYITCVIDSLQLSLIGLIPYVNAFSSNSGSFFQLLLQILEICYNSRKEVECLIFYI